MTERRVAEPQPFPFATMWRRIGLALLLSTGFGLLLGLEWQSGLVSLLTRTTILGLVATAVFGVFERWPRRLPGWIARWALQVAAVGVAMPAATFLIYIITTPDGAPPFWRDPDRRNGFIGLAGLGVLAAPWIALAALVRQKEALARHQALEFELERSELERQALDARLHLLQAQVAPHFLFNTLANIQALVDAGSPQASALLRSLIAYLRAAVPLLNEPVATLAQEVDLARAYLELMHMRIPDRLRFALHVDPAALSLRCPPTALLTLVENAVRHGIDPSEEGGSIEIRIERRGDRVAIRVSDSGIGFRAANRGLGTGLATLHERLQLMFGGEAQLNVVAGEPNGVRAELEMPAWGGAR
ncbi:MAG TPA: histidine kinase [Thermoanaerobaculia bacterium]|jgi:signal transduction histidine kinase